MNSVLPSISPQVSALAPGFRALSIDVVSAAVRAPLVGSDALRSACQAVIAGEPQWAEAHLQAWNEVFRAFGAKPKRTPCSAEALRRRVLRDGEMAAIDPIVDLYNAVSLRYAVPVGGENLAAYVGAPHLKLADGSEPFDTVKEGQIVPVMPGWTRPPRIGCLFATENAYRKKRVRYFLDWLEVRFRKMLEHTNREYQWVA